MMRAMVRRLLGEYGVDPAKLDAAVADVIHVFAVAVGPSPVLPPPRYRLPDERLARTGKLVILDGAESHKYYVTVGYFDDGLLGEVFVKKAREGSTVGALLDAVATAISIGLQYGIPWEVYAKKFAHWRFPPNGLTEDEDVALKMVASPLDYLVRWVSRRLRVEDWPRGDGDG